MYNQGTSLVARRRVSQTLTKLRMPQFNLDSDTLNCSEIYIEEEAKELFEHFVVEQIRRECLKSPMDCLPCVSTPEGYQNPMWAKAGRELRVMADKFAETKERDRIKEKAEQGAVLCSSFHYLPRVILVVGMAFIIGVGISKLWNKP